MAVVSSLLQDPHATEEATVTKEIAPRLIFSVGSLEVTSTVVNTWVMMTIIGMASFFIGRSFRVRPGLVQNAIEWFVQAINELIRNNVGIRDTSLFLPVVASLAVFVGSANLMGLIPGLHSPTPDINTPLAMALIVFVSVPYFGIRTRGLWGYLKHYVEPIFLMLPIEIASEVARTFSLTFRLFGNILGEEIIIVILFIIAPFIVPVPMMLFSIFTGLLQAYIFTLLTCVYIGGAVKAHG
ncbi:MAG: F0F1 ATP synthase subunit A [Anaerolineae bacterium]|nr:F0F1 ATP synthase subunit A [Anaerolineae bacterium]